MIGYVITAGLFAALSTFQVVCGIDGSASCTGIVFSNFLEPLFIADRLDSFKIGPDFYPMRHCSLEHLQVVAGILFTFAAKIDAPFLRTSRHFAFSTVRQPFPGATTVARALFL
jgi:hypothetical protein